MDVASECHMRCIIHQAYYAALNQIYHEIDNRLFFRIDKEDRKRKVHQAAIDACTNQIGKLPKDDARRDLLNNVANSMRRARALRVTADYDMSDRVYKTQADIAVRYANQIFDDLEQYQ